jgi:hypothetical protein
MNVIGLKLLTSLARAVLIGVSLLILVPLVLALLADMGARSAEVTSWPPSVLFLRSMVLLVCLPIHTVAAIRRRHGVFPLHAVLSVIIANLALIGTDAGAFFCPVSLTAVVVVFCGSYWLRS